MIFIFLISSFLGLVTGHIYQKLNVKFEWDRLFQISEIINWGYTKSGQKRIRFSFKNLIYRSNYVKLILYRTNSIYVCTPGKHTVLYSTFHRSGVIEKARPSTVSRGILNLMLTIIVLIHICLSPINRIGTSLRNGNYPICLMINVKRKRKEEGSPLGIKFCCLYFFSQKIERWIDIFFYWICIRRDWRGSNPQLPPWQGGALTNWTTIPSKYHNHNKVYIFLWFHSNPFNLFRLNLD